jgi:hypothetical protein
VNGASGTSDMDRRAARVAARESGDERVQYHDEYLYSLDRIYKIELDFREIWKSRIQEN